MTDGPIMFGDDDPEDAWTATDPVDVELENIADRVRWILEHLRLRRSAEDQDLADHAQRLMDDLVTIVARVRARDLD
jgi:hypothetical protein